MIQLCTEKEVRDMVCFTLSFSLYSVVSALEEPTVTDNSETVVEEIPEDSTLTDEPEETTEITTPEETDPSTEQTKHQRKQILLQNRQLPFLKKKTITRRKRRLERKSLLIPKRTQEHRFQVLGKYSMIFRNQRQLRN